MAYRSRWRPSARTTPTWTAAARRASTSARRVRTPSAATSPSTGSSSTPSAARWSTSSAGWRTCAPASSALSATPARASPRTACACCAPCASPPAPAGGGVASAGGLADLRAGTPRALGAPRARIAGARPRMLRAVRFAARLRFTIEPVTRAAIAARVTGSIVKRRRAAKRTARSMRGRAPAMRARGAPRARGVPARRSASPPAEATPPPAGAGGEAHGAQHAQAVLGDARAGVADSADDAGAQVRQPADEVDHLAAEGVEEEPVDGEVAALGVRTRRAEVDARRAAAVHVGVVRAEGRHLERHPVLDHQDDAELRADRHGAPEERLHGLRGRAGGDVEVERLAPEEP